uniref:Uncharacterized protein n=1 Tax=Anguilla anguilla TaxID=7936 RepID=A0A0E9X674_ANGAN
MLFWFGDGEPKPTAVHLSNQVPAVSVVGYTTRSCPAESNGQFGESVRTHLQMQIDLQYSVLMPLCVGGIKVWCDFLPIRQEKAILCFGEPSSSDSPLVCYGFV